MPRVHTFARTGNHIVIKVDGIEVGLMQNLRCSDDYGMEPISGIGSIQVKEHAPTVARHQLSAGLVAIRRDLLVEKEIIPENGDDALKGWIFDVEIYDRRDNQLLRTYIGCSFASGDTSIDAHRVISRNVSMMALDVRGQF